MDSLIPEEMKVGGRTEQQERYDKLTGAHLEWWSEELKKGTLNVTFTWRQRVKFAWRAFRWPYALRNALHFTQEAKTCLEEIDNKGSGMTHDVFLVDAPDLTGDAIEEMEKAEELLKFLQDY